jgi:hypothetical protein
VRFKEITAVKLGYTAFEVRLIHYILIIAKWAEKYNEFGVLNVEIPRFRMVHNNGVRALFRYKLETIR